MSEAEQIKTIIAAARTAPTKVAAIVDSQGKEERFLTAFRKELPASEFSLKVMPMRGLGAKVRAIFIERIQARDISAN